MQCLFVVSDEQEEQQQATDFPWLSCIFCALAFIHYVAALHRREGEGLPSGDSTDLQPSHIAWYLKVQCKDFMKFTDFENFELPCPTRTIAMVGWLIFSSEWSHIQCK